MEKTKVLEIYVVKFAGTRYTIKLKSDGFHTCSCGSKWGCRHINSFKDGFGDLVSARRLV